MDAVRILIVDDDREDAELIEDLLADVDGWKPVVTVVTSYEEGRATLTSGHVDVCLLDYQLGARTGLDFLREPDVAEAGVPVILLTGWGSRALDDEALRAGAADFLPKQGLSLTELDRAIRYAVERRRRRRAEARAEARQANSRELIAVLGKDGTLLYVSPSMERVLGHRPDEKVGRNLLDEVHPDDRAGVEAAVQGLMDTPARAISLQYRLRHADGDWRVMDAWAENYLSAPDIRGIVVGAWDVTERLAQRERIAFQAKLLGAVGQAVIATDLEGSVIYWNRAAESLYGWSEEEALGRPILELTPADVGRERAAEILGALSKGEEWSGEMTLRRADGSTFLGLITNAPILDAQGNPQGILGVSSDISALKRTEGALRERVKEMNLLLRASQIIQRTDVPVEERLQRIVDLIPSGWLHPDVTEARIVVDASHVATPGFVETQWRLSAPIPLGEGESSGRLDVVLTEERPAQDQGPFLAEEVELIQTLADIVSQALERGRLTRVLAQTVASLAEAVVLLDTGGGDRVIRDVNPAAERIFGYTREELLGVSVAKLHVDRAAFDAFSGQLNAALSRRGVFNTSYPLMRKDGTVFDAELTLTLLDPDKGLEGGLVAAVRDVSEQRRAEAELRRTEERFGALIRQITDVIFVVDREGKVVSSSPSVEGLAGYDADEFEGMNALELVHPEDRESVASLLGEVLEIPSGTLRGEYRIVTRSDDVRYVESVARNLTDHPAVGGVVVTTRDITERVRFEETLRQTQKLEAIGRLAGGIAHDFNNILTVIRAQLDLVLPDLHDPGLVSDLHLIRSSADRAARLTGQLLAYSREQMLMPRVVDLADVVRGMGKMLDRILGEDIAIVYQLGDDVPPVEVDPAQLEQVVLNLAVNARDAMPHGGRLTLSTTGEELGPGDLASLPGMTPGHYARLTVADTGHGMSPTVLARIFEPFFTTKEKGKGTGLGLAMAYGVMKQSGGGIHAESAPGRGAAFHLRFPAVAGEPEALGDDGVALGEADHLTGAVLVVEDDDAVRRVCSKILEGAGFKVTVAAHAEAAMEVMQSDAPIDVVLTDLVMPGMGGRGLVDWMRSYGREVPLVVMSGYDADSGGHGDLPRDVTFLQKPFTRESLLAMIRRALSRA